jgi:hypothetical protein
MKLKRLLFENEEQEGEILEFIALDLLKDEIESGDTNPNALFKGNYIIEKITPIIYKDTSKIYNIKIFVSDSVWILYMWAVNESERINIKVYHSKIKSSESYTDSFIINDPYNFIEEQWNYIKEFIEGFILPRSTESNITLKEIEETYLYIRYDLSRDYSNKKMYIALAKYLQSSEDINILKDYPELQEKLKGWNNGALMILFDMIRTIDVLANQGY